MGIVFILSDKKVIFKDEYTDIFYNYHHNLCTVFEKWACFADLLSEVFKKDI